MLALVGSLTTWVSVQVFIISVRLTGTSVLAGKMTALAGLVVAVLALVRLLGSPMPAAVAGMACGIGVTLLGASNAWSVEDLAELPPGSVAPQVGSGLWLTILSGIVMFAVGVWLVRMPAAVAPATVASAVAPGWWPDPYGRFHVRWHDGTSWTAHVGHTAPDGSRRQYLDPG